MRNDVSKLVPDNITWIRAAVSCIPVVGGALDHLIFDKADAIRIKNLEIAIAALSNQIETSGQDTVDKSWFSSEEALAAFKLMSDKVSYEPDRRKIEALGKITAACGSKEHSHDAKKLSVVEHLSRLSAIQIRILAVIAEIVPSKRKLDFGTLQQTASAIWASDIVTALRAEPQFWEGTLQIDEELEVLVSYNTIRQVEIMGPSENAYVITSIGKVAASYLKTAGL